LLVAVAVSGGLALAAWRRPRASGLLLAVAAVLLLATVLDVRELVHQLDESRTGLAVLAGVVAALHAAAAGVAVAMRRAAAARV